MKPKPFLLLLALITTITTIPPIAASEEPAYKGPYVARTKWADAIEDRERLEREEQDRRAEAIAAEDARRAQEVPTKQDLEKRAAIKREREARQSFRRASRELPKLLEKIWVALYSSFFHHFTS